MELEGGLELPPSSSEVQPPKKTFKWPSAGETCGWRGELIIDLRDGHVAGFSNDDGRIDPLYQRLQTLKNSGRNACTQRGLRRGDVVCVDKDTPYGLMHQVMNTAAEAGFPKFRMAVLME